MLVTTSSTDMKFLFVVSLMPGCMMLVMVRSVDRQKALEEKSGRDQPAARDELPHGQFGL